MKPYFETVCGPLALAHGIRKLLGDPDLGRHLAARARLAALERHDLKGLIHRMETLYGSLLAEKGGRTCASW